MTMQIQNKAKTIQSQKGAVAIIVALSLIAMIGVLGLVLDLGHLYVAKTELQNAADAAALSGAKELNGKIDGVNNAVTRAIEAAGLNNYDINATAVTITSSNLEFSNSPNGPWVNVADAQANPNGRTFLKVDTGNLDFNTWFIQVLPGVASTMQTFGMAVAGRYTLEVTPMGVCAVDKNRPEHGFLRGVAYNIPKLNPLSNGDPIWINPIDSAPGPCSANSTSANNMAPYVCTGKSTTITSIPGVVWVDTGNKSSMENPLNSRFGKASSYIPAGNPLSCDPANAPADTNVKEYICTKAGGGPNPDNCVTNPPTGSPRNWMNPTNNTTPTIQGIEMIGSKPFNYPVRSINSPPNPPAEIPANFERYGVLWSYSKEIKNFSTTPYTEYSTADWPTLYGGNVDPSYPSTPPYHQAAGSIFHQPPTGLGAAKATPDRRVLNLVIIDCAGVVLVPGQACRQTLPVLAVGKFFMQHQADLPGDFVAEFTGIIAPPLPPAVIRLYR